MTTLHALRLEDLEQLRLWRNDEELRARCRQLGLLTEADQERWWQRITAAGRTDFMFGVHAGAQLIGCVGLCHWSPRDRTAEVSFYIGHAGARRQGHAERALRLLHAYGFDELGLTRIWAEAYEFNVPGIRLLRKLGYVDEGRQRQHVFRQGRQWDSVMLGLLREEWTR